MLSAQELFDSLIRSKRQSFSGAYRHFLQFELPSQLPSQLQAEDLVCGLRWCAAQERARGHIDDCADAITGIVSRSVSHLGQPDILTAFAEYVISRVTQHDELALQSEQFDAISDEHRHALINAIVPRLEDIKKHSYALLGRVPVIVRECDLGWLLEMSANASTPDDQTQWAKLARQRFLFGCQNGLDEVLHCCESNSVVAEVFSDLIQPVELDSEQAEEMRARYARSLELEERSRAREEPPLLDPAPPVRVEDCLRRFEAGDLTGWWQVNRELQLEFRSTHYRHDFQDDLTELPGWNSANDDTRQRLVAAAKRYILEWKARPWEWLGRRIYHYPDFAGYRALVLIEQTDPDFLSSLNSERWANLAPAIIGFPTSSGIGNDSEIRQERLLAQSCAFAPDVVINALLTLIDHEDGEKDGKHLFVLRRVKDCRDRRVGLALLQKARNRSLKATSVAELIEDAFERDPTAGERLAMSLFLNGRAVGKSRCWFAASRQKRLSRRCGRHARAPVRRSRMGHQLGKQRDAANCHQRRARAREVARRLGVVIWLNSSDRWDNLWPHFESDWQLFRDVMSDVAHEHRQSRIPPADLTEDQLGELFTALSQQFPQQVDPKHDGVHRIGPRESVQHYRDGVLSSLRGRGTTAALQAVARVKNALPHLPFLDWVQRAAHRAMLEATWRPTPVGPLRELIGRQKSRLVRSERELQKVVIESLARLQQQLHGENPSVRDIWDHDRKNDLWAPVDENAFSDYLVRHLRADLRGCGIVALREVEIRRGNDGSGERTDLYVNAQMHGAEPDSWDSVRVILEVKGCWHQEVKTAMESQLKDRYLRDNDCGHGIYVVGWFECDSWNTGDTRRGKTPKMSVAEAREFFAKQGSQVSDTNNFITSCVLDASLR